MTGARKRGLAVLGLLVLATLGAGCVPAVAAPSGDGVPPDGAAPRTAASTPGLPQQDTAQLPTLPPRSEVERVPTRVRVAALGIDLPVVKPPRDPNHYPLCDVAEFIELMSRPGSAGTTFLYAHARPGMFLPILEASRRDDGRSMAGILIEVYTSDDLLFTYEGAEVRRHVTSLDFAYRATVEQLILQTSEGPQGTPGKTLLIATPAGEQPAGHAAAHPLAHPVDCGP